MIMFSSLVCIHLKIYFLFCFFAGVLMLGCIIFLSGKSMLYYLPLNSVFHQDSSPNSQRHPKLLHHSMSTERCKIGQKRSSVEAL